MRVFQKKKKRVIGQDREDNVGKAKEQLSPRMNIGASTFRQKG